MTAKNNPLGAKFQHGVNHAMVMDADPLIITGSDDILSINFLKNIIKESKDNYFIGLRSWYIFHETRLWHFDYLAPGGLPLGGGRIYSKAFLDKIDWKLFDTGINKLLDDSGWNAVKQNAGSKYKLLNTPEILAIKGAWQTMNPFTARHRNIRKVAVYDGQRAKQIMKEKFNYDGKI